MDEAHLEHIIEAGYAHVEERQEARGAAMARQVALDRGAAHYPGTWPLALVQTRWSATRGMRPVW